MKRTSAPGAERLVTRVSELYSVLNSVQAVARFPVQFFQRPARELLTYVIPVAFATTFPAQALLGEADLRLLPVGGALAANASAAATLPGDQTISARCPA